MWASKIFGERLANVVLRFLPVILFAALLPKPYKLVLSTTLPRLLLFLVALLLAAILMVALVILYHIICLFTLDEKGIVNIFMIAADILSGLTLPIPFFLCFFKT